LFIDLKIQNAKPICAFSFSQQSDASKDTHKKVRVKFCGDDSFDRNITKLPNAHFYDFKGKKETEQNQNSG